MKRKLMVIMSLCLLISMLGSSTFAGEEAGIWQLETTISPHMYCNAAVAVENEIYVIPGDRNASNKKINIYDTRARTWRTAGNLLRDGVAMTSCIVGDKIYIIGGLCGPAYGNSDALNTLQIYNTKTDSCTLGAEMPTKRYGATCIAVGDKIYVIGGYENNQLVSNKVEIYNISNNTWETGASIPHGVHMAAAAAYVDNIYIFGGIGTFQNQAYDRAQIYNIETNTWSEGQKMPYAVGEAAYTTIGNKLYLVGGCTNANDGALDTAIIYDFDNDQWTTSASILTRRSAGWLVPVNNKLYLGGGASHPLNIFDMDSIESLEVGFNSQLSVLLNIDETVQLSVMSDLSENSKVTWRSSNEAVATVDDRGKVTAAGEGTAYINAKNGDGTFDQSISVKVVPADADSYRLAMHLNTGEKQKLYLTEDPSAVTWSSMDTAVAGVSNSGEVTAVKKGLCIVQAKLGEETYNIYVRVA